MNETQKTAVREEIAEQQAIVDGYNQTIADAKLAITQGQKTVYIYNQQLANAQARIAALNEGL